MLLHVLELMGYQNPIEQAQFIQIYHASGALTQGNIPEEILTQKEASEFINGNYNVIYDSIPVDMHFHSSIDALKWLNTLGQEQMERYRPKGTERHQIDITRWSKHSAIITEDLENLGFFKEIIPSNPKVDALMILGAGEEGTSMRYTYASELIAEGKIQPRSIYLLSGDRSLSAGSEKYKINSEPILMDLLEKRIKEKVRVELQISFDKAFEMTDNKNGQEIEATRSAIIQNTEEKYGITWPTELDMMIELFNQTPLSEYEVHYVNAPKIKVTQTDGTTTWKRPNTKSTVTQLIHQYQLEGKDVVFMSSQPYCRYQSGIIIDIMRPPKYKVYMAASAAPALKENQKAVLGLEAFFSSIYSNKERIESILTQEISSKVKP